MRRRMLTEGGDDKVEKPWKEICNVVLEEEARGIRFEEHVDALNLTEFIIQINGTCTNSGDGSALVEVNGIQIPNIISMKKKDTDISSGYFWRQIYNVGRIACGTEGSGAYGNMTNNVKQSAHILLPEPPFVSINVLMSGAVQTMSSGTQFILYGR